MSVKSFFRKKSMYLFLSAVVAVTFWGCPSPEPKEKFDGDIVYNKTVSLGVSTPAGLKAGLQDIKYANGKIYAAFYYLDAEWSPAAKSKIFVFDAQTFEKSAEFESNFMNVLQIEVRGNDLYVIDGGSYFASDGGLTKINLSNGDKTALLDGAALGASPKWIEFVSDNEAYLLMSPSWKNQYVAKYTVGASSVTAVAELSDKNPVDCISYNTYTSSLWFGFGTSVQKFSPASQSVTFSATTSLPVIEIKSVGGVTLTVESDYTAGKYGVVYDLGLSDTLIKYYPKDIIASDAKCGFAGGNFFILERLKSGGVIFLTADADIIKQLPFTTSAFFNPSAVCGDGNGKIFISSLEDLSIAVFDVKK